MAKIRKAVFRNGFVMLSLLAAIVLSSSVAYAQRCEAQAATTGAVATVRAEGMTEMIGGIQLRCVPATGTSLFDPTDFTLSITLNTPITDLADVDYAAFQLTDTGGVSGTSIDEENFNGDNANNEGPMVDEDEDPNTVTWEDLDADALNLAAGESGFDVIITGIRANAYMVGDGGEITGPAHCEHRARGAGGGRYLGGQNRTGRQGGRCQRLAMRGPWRWEWPP